MQQELELSHKDNLKFTENMSKFADTQKKLEFQRDQAQNKNDNLKLQIKKLEEQNTDMDIRLKVSTVLRSQHNSNKP